jgi:hypothetical protein
MVAVRWLGWFVALGALTLTCIPAAWWHHPSTDVVQTGFDPNLDYITPGGMVSRDVVILTPPTGRSGSSASTVSINLLATPLDKFNASMRLEVNQESPGTVPLRIGVWSPWTGAGYFLVFDSSGSSIHTEALVRGGAGTTLTGGEVTRSMQLGTYLVGQPYRIQISVDKPKAMTVQVTGSGVNAEDAVMVTDIPDLFRSTRLALSASTRSSVGVVRAELSDYSFKLPHQTYWANRADDNVERYAFILLLILASLVVIATSMEWLVQHGRRLSHPAQRGSGGQRKSSSRAQRTRVFAGITVAIAAYLVGNALLFPLGGHPFDMGVEKLYAYVARTYGITQLYFLPNVVSQAANWGGVPLIEAAFPYQPVFAYLFSGIGWLQSLIFTGGGSFTLDSRTLEYVIKAVNVLFGLGDAVLIYLILKQLRMSQRWSRGGAAFFLFNPAVWFSAAVWGQTHVISIFLVLAAVLLAEKGLPLWAWLALAIACFTRPQMLVFGLLVGIVLLRKFTWKQNLLAVAWTITLVFIGLAPLTAFTSPSLPIDIMVNVIRIQEAGGNEVALTTVSQDALSVWPLVTYAAHGASGLQRAFTPSSASLVGSLTYLRLGQILTLAALVIVGAALLFRKRVVREPGAYLPFVALGITSFLMLLTGLTATHFLLALPFLLLCSRWMGIGAYIYIGIIWTVTTLVPMYGDMGQVLSAQQYPLLAPENNFVTRFFVQVYSSDRFITVAVVANICAVIWLAYLSFRPAVLAGGSDSSVSMA